MIETLQDRIMRHEGFCAIPKPDAKGMYVVGFGHDLSETASQEYSNGISTQDAIELLDKDIATAKYAVASELPWTLGLSEIRQEVFVEMAFQMGINGLLEFRNMLALAREGNVEAVNQHMLESAWHNETPSRCEELANLYLNNGEKNE